MMNLTSFFCLLLFLLCNLVTIASTHSFSSSSYAGKLCHDNESWALMQLKESFVISDDCDPSTYSKLESWKILEGKKGDCCSWDGVECDSETNHVFSLDLSNNCLFGSINSNTTLFSLVHLQRLNLAYNHFNLAQIPSKLGSLTKLTHLNLSFSEFSGQIPSAISNLSGLVSLDLSGNAGLNLQKLGMKGLVQNLIHLKQLHLSGVVISSSVPDLSNILSLESLKLAKCGLHGEFPIGIFQLPKLKILDISGNNLQSYLPNFQQGSPLVTLQVSETRFRGEIPSSIGNLLHLESLDISWCNFTGQLPSSLGNLTNLSLLDFSNNNFQGYSIPSWIGKLTKLTSLDLHGINLNGSFPSQLMNLTQLSFLDLGYCQLTGSIPSWLMNLTQLSYIFLDHNQLIGEIPSWLIYGNNVEILFFGSNQLSGQIPPINITFSPLYHLDLSSNRLQGSIPKSLSKLRNLMLLELHSNSLVGELHINAFSKLSNLLVLSLSFNNLSLLTETRANLTSIQNFMFLGLASCNISEFPSFLHGQDELEFLDLSSNNIHGQVPSWVWNISTNSLSFLNLSYNSLTGFEQASSPIVHQWAHLRVLDLGSNKLQGSLSTPPPFPLKWTKACKLRMLNLKENQIQGQIPRSLAYCAELEFLDLSNNQFNDTFPSWLGALQELKVLILRANGFYGAIVEQEPYSKFSKLQIVDLSHNHLTGELPSMYFDVWSAMKVTNASHMRYLGKNHEFSVSSYYETYDYSMIMNNKGSETKYLKIPNTLAAIDFSHNQFQGEIPNVIGDLKGLHLLNLSSNVLHGHIPLSLVRLKELESLDLSSNKLSGQIPSRLKEMTFLSSFNVAYNQLEGPIPQGNQFDTFEEMSYKGNSGLCGAPLKKKCGKMEEASPPSSNDEGSRFPIEFGWKVVLLGYGSGFVVGGVVGHIFSRRKNGWFVTTFGRQKPARNWFRN